MPRRPARVPLPRIRRRLSRQIDELAVVAPQMVRIMAKTIAYLHRDFCGPSDGGGGGLEHDAPQSIDRAAA